MVVLLMLERRLWLRGTAAVFGGGTKPPTPSGTIAGTVTSIDGYAARGPKGQRDRHEPPRRTTRRRREGRRLHDQGAEGTTTGWKWSCGRASNSPSSRRRTNINVGDLDERDGFRRRPLIRCALVLRSSAAIRSSSGGCVEKQRHPAAARR